VAADAKEDEKDRTGGVWWRSAGWNASALIALTSVLLALVYNTVQVRNSSRQLNQAQRSLELSSRANTFSTLMQMHDRIVRADAATSKAVLSYRAHASPAAATALINAITPLEGVVYALDHQIVPLPGANDLWTNYLVCDYRSAEQQLGPTLAGYVPELARFSARHPGHRRCVVAVVG